MTSFFHPFIPIPLSTSLALLGFEIGVAGFEVLEDWAATAMLVMNVSGADLKTWALYHKHFDTDG